MSQHSLFSPSSAVRWMNCPGSMAFPENREQDGGSSTFADDGTASHDWAALCLQSGKDAALFLGSVKEINDKLYTIDEERAEYIQVYLDDVQRRAMGGLLFVEHKVDLGEMSGTCDAAIIVGNHLIVEDLKYGTGEKVYAQIDGKINPQLGLYLLGLLVDARLLGIEIETVTGVICQPRLGHIDEHTITLDELYAFRREAVEGMQRGQIAITKDAPTDLHPGEKQCRWCRAKSQCPALAKYVADQVRCDFDTVAAEPPPVPPRDTTKLGQAYMAVPLIEDWCRAVRADVAKLVQDGVTVLGPDGKGYKLVEGREGSRAWSDPQAAESALVGQLGPKAYSEPKLLTAPAAAKLLDKKATKQTWKDVFEPLIKKPPGKPVLAMGSDPRPPYSGTATSDDFEDIAE